MPYAYIYNIGIVASACADADFARIYRAGSARITPPYALGIK